jgi:hypothetical protein
MRTHAAAALVPAGCRAEGRVPAAFTAAREAIRPRALATTRAPAADAARALAALAPGIRAVAFFGSQRTKAGPDRFSAHDFYVVVDAYGPFYAALHRAGRLRRSPRVLAFLNRILTPNQISLRLPAGEGGELHAKCSIISVDQLHCEVSPWRCDHFTIGRLFQPAELVFSRDAAAEADTLDALATAAVATYFWGRPRLPPSFDADTYVLAVLRESLRREVRPEPTGRRAEALHEAQRAEQVPVYQALLEGLRQDGELRLADGGASSRYVLAERVGLLERLHVELYFRWSTARATLRWFKYVVTFDGWLDYLLRKVERHTGQKVELTESERAHPLLLLWPKVIRYLRHKNDRPSGPS